eukprot:m.188057 g.188057  ORF g.188057 m.188057 type:complete len:1956 (-) comp16717_c2_seq1:255-6122(-)
MFGGENAYDKGHHDADPDDVDDDNDDDDEDDEDEDDRALDGENHRGIHQDQQPHTVSGFGSGLHSSPARRRRHEQHAGLEQRAADQVSVGDSDSVAPVPAETRRRRSRRHGPSLKRRDDAGLEQATSPPVETLNTLSLRQSSEFEAPDYHLPEQQSPGGALQQQPEVGSFSHDVSNVSETSVCVDGDGEPRQSRSSLYVWGSNSGGQMDYLFPGAREMEQVSEPSLCTLLPPDVEIAKACIQKEGVYILARDGRLFSSTHASKMRCVASSSSKHKIVDVSYGGYHALAVTEHGHVVACGTGKNGKLGLRDTRDRSRFERIPNLRHVARVACGRRHSGAVTKSGQLFMWGCNHHGRLGLGDENDRHEPALVLGIPPVQMVACGDRHTVALTRDGHVYSWGCGEQGRLGVTSPHRKMPTPMLVSGLSEIVKVVCGCNSSAALSASGQMYVWGTGRSYRLGNNSIAARWRPGVLSDLALVKLVDISLGHEHGAAVSDKGAVYVWGSNDSSQLGGCTDAAVSPVPRMHPELSQKGLNRIECGSRTCIAWRDLSNVVELDGHHNVNIQPLVVPEDRMGMQSIEHHDNVAVERVVQQGSNSPSLLAVLSHLPDFESQHKSVSYLLKALRVYHARQLVTLWLSRGPDSLERVPWSADRLMLVLIDLMRLMAARVVTSEQYRVVAAAIHNLCGQHNHLSRTLVEVCVKETQRLLPSSKGFDEHMLTDEFILVKMCSLGLIRATIDCTISYSSGLSMLRLAHALASLWIRNHNNDVRQWVLARLKTLLHNGDPQFLAELRRLVHFSERDHGTQRQEDGTSEDLKQGTGSNHDSDTESEEGGDDDHHLQGAQSLDDSRTDSNTGGDGLVGVLSVQEFASFNVSGSGHLNLCELSLLLTHREVDNCYFQLTHTLAQLNIPFGHRFDYEATFKFLSESDLAHTPHGSLFDYEDDESLMQSSVGISLREFANSLWACLEQQQQHETTMEKDGRILIRSEYNRIMCRVAAGLNLPPGGNKPSWFQVYCQTSNEFNALVDRRSFSPEFVDRIRSALEGRADEQEDRESRLCENYLDNQRFTAEMDKQILDWKATTPEELRLAYAKDKVPAVNLPRLTFKIGEEGNVRTLNENTTVFMQPEATEENTWVLGDEILTSGMHYWTVRCDTKGSTRRYVGVGVGKPNAPYPLGAARILSEGILKSGTSAITIPQGFGANDVVGVFLDLNRNTVAFDVNGQKRGEIELPGLAPGEGVQPLVYMFYPGDKMSFVYGLPVPLCYRLSTESRAFFEPVGRRSHILRAAPSVDSSKVGVLSPSANGNQVILAIDYRSNREGVWVRLANPDSMWGDSSVWCLLRDATGSENLTAVANDQVDMTTVINFQASLPSEVLSDGLTSVAGKHMAHCVTPTTKHSVRAGPSNDAMVIGSIDPNMIVYYTDIVKNEEGEWLVLDGDSKQRVVEPNMKHLDAYTLLRGVEGIVHFKPEDEPKVVTAAPARYTALQGIPVGQIKRRCFLLETLSSAVMSLISLIEFQSLETNSGISLGLGGTQKALQALQDLTLLTHKERLIKAVISRTTSASAARVTITLNRVQIHRQPSGVAGIYGQNSVFAQACRELRTADASVFLVPQRCWKVKFAGEGVDDAGGGYSESISEMCEELVNDSLTLLIPTPNRLQDSGDSRDAYLFNPAATSSAELELFEFLGVLIGIAIRTNSPISLPLAGPVWKQLTGLALTTADLREVAADYVSSLEFIKSLVPDEEVFASCAFSGDTPSAKEGLTYQVVNAPRLTAASRDEYVRKALHIRLHEFDLQVQAVRRGMARVVPVPLLSTLQPSQLQDLVIGKQEIDLGLLQLMTRYKGLTAHSPLAEWFWKAMQQFTPVELSLFLRFVSGRTRLPRTRADFDGKNFVLQALDRYEAGSPQADSALPEALTCFFTLKIPRYSSFEVLLHKLRYAINNCKAIDTDNYARTTLPTGS